MRNSLKSTIILTVIALIWGMSFVWVDYSLDNGFTSNSIIMIRGLVPGLILLPFVFKAKIYKNLKQMLIAIAVGIVTFLGFLFQVLGQQLSTPGNSAFYTGLYAVFTPFFTVFITRKGIELKNILAAILAIAGIFFISLFGQVLSGNFTGFGLSELYLVLCAIFFSFQLILMSYGSKKTDPIASASVYLITLGICGLIATLITGEKVSFNWLGVANVCLITFVSSLFTTILHFYVSKISTGTKMAIILSLETPFAYINSVMVGKDQLTFYAIIGLFFVLAATIITSLELKRYDLSKYKNILIDLDNTILNFNKSEEIAFKKLLEHYNIKFNNKIFSDYKEENHRLWKLYEENKYAKEQIFDDRFKYIFDKYEIKDIDPHEASIKYLELLGNEVYYMPFAKKAIVRLANKYNVYLISNGQIDVQKSRLEISGLNKLFKKAYISEEVGYQKPLKEFFDYVKKDINYVDEETIVIGDSLTSDIKGASVACLDCVLVSDTDLDTDLNINYRVNNLWQIK